MIYFHFILFYFILFCRLDRPCSGVVVFAKTVSSANKLSELFKNRLTGKNYFCVVNGEVNQNQNQNLFHMIEKTQNSKVCIFDVDNDNINKLSSSDTDDNNNSNYSNKGNDNEKNKINLNIDKNKDKNKNNMKNSPHMELITAKLKFEKILTIAGGADRNDRQSVLKVELETGRKHQIRAQLSHIGLMD